jgi:5'-nucleotidase (lipoprotein e(P4) family)
VKQLGKNFIAIILCLLVSISVPANPSTALENNSKLPRNESLQWYRTAAEKNAIYREIFLLAEIVIRNKIKLDKLQPHQWGIILDIDETTLDNTAWNLLQAKHQSQQSWNEFAAKEISMATPGVQHLIDSVHRSGGYINFVSNRPARLQTATEKNLQHEHIYFDQVLLDTTNMGTSMVDKNQRFQAIQFGKKPSKLPKQNIVAWFGDNIQDFPVLKQADLSQKNGASADYQLFGKVYFCLPNPIYGSWLNNPLR